MSGLAALCRARTALTEEDIATLEGVERTLSLVADLLNEDVFIDCMGADGVALVAAEAKPRLARSRYTRTVVGEPALPENEPAVYQAFREGLPVHDIKAVTQQNITVMQDVAPIRNAGGSIIAVLILERDVSRQVLLEEKISAVEAAQGNGGNGAVAAAEDVLFARELHHRIKNNLQMIASICNMRIREARHEETRTRLRENANMILTVAALHDMLSESAADQPRQPVPLARLLARVAEGLRSLLGSGSGIFISLACDDVMIRQERAAPVALVVNELLTNAVEHAFRGRETGRVTIHLQRGSRYCTVIVEDDGAGFPQEGAKGLGLTIASMTVADKLDGELSFFSDSQGTKALFRFLP